MKNTKAQKKLNNINIDELISDYAEVFSYEDVDDRLDGLRDNWDILSYTDKVLIVLYSEYGSFRKASSILGVSHSTYRRFYLEAVNRLCE